MKQKYFDILPSTQSYIKEHLDLIEDDEYIIAKMQTQGRGRTGNQWISNSENLMFSFKFNPQNINPNNYALITLVTGIAMRNTLASITRKNDFQIKWPNDIIIDNKKVCGIIAEGVFNSNEYNIIIGIGVNVNQEKFDDSIVNKATSLKNVFNQDFDNEKILIRFDTEFQKYMQYLENNNLEFIQEINQYNYLKNKQVNINNDQYLGKEYACLSIAENGNLRLQDKENRIIEINSNEVTLSNIYQ